MVYRISLSFLFAAMLGVVGCASIVQPTAVVHADTSTAIQPAQVVVVEEIKPTVNEAVPDAVVPSIAAPVESVDIVLSEKDVECLAQSIYYEARGEGIAGMSAVGYVVINRTTAKGFPTTICGVVYEKRFVKGRAFCQFSWACHPRGRIHQPTYLQAREIAIQVLKREIRNPVGKALFFHERSVKPRFAKAHNFVATVGNHRFYSAL